ncbi:MAG: pilus assembly protein [Pseudomonadota bacterium]|nr:pilus assembly protein [Pseudomonadota bacterium]
MRKVPNRAAQRGVVLAVVLILLLVMTLLAVASLSGTVLDERMSTAQLDRNIAMQAAEAALREAEEIVRDEPDVQAAGTCSAGICAKPDFTDPDEQQRWLIDGFWDDPDNGWAETVISIDGLTARPKYIIELIDDAVTETQNCTTGGDVSLEAACTQKSSRYRITVFSAAENRAAVMLQSIYAIP